MAICSRDIEAVDCNQCFFMGFDFVCGDAGEQKEKLNQLSIPWFMANTIVQNFESVHHPICKLHLFQ